MHILYYPRQFGKTQYLIDKALQNPGSVIITSTVNEATTINKQAGKPVAMPYYMFNKNKKGHKVTAIYVDNLEHVMSSMFGNVDIITISDATIDNKKDSTEFQF